MSAFLNHLLLYIMQCVEYFICKHMLTFKGTQFSPSRVQVLSRLLAVRPLCSLVLYQAYVSKFCVL